MTGGSLLVGLCLLLHSAVSSVAGFYAVWIGLGAGLAATLYNPVFAVVTRRFPDDFRRAIITLTFPGRAGQHRVHPALGVADPGAGLAPGAVGAGRLSAAGLRASACGAVARRTTPAASRAHPAAARGRRRLPLHLRSAPFLLIGVFVVGMMGVTAALPPHMISLLRGNGLAEAWVIAIPASIGLIQVLGRLLLFFFEHHFDLHLANRLIPMLIPLGLAALLAGAGHPWAALLFVLLYGLGNGMLTIVKGTAIAQYVSRDHVASLNGALGLPSALARALAPCCWACCGARRPATQWGLWLLLVVSVARCWR